MTKEKKILFATLTALLLTFVITLIAYMSSPAMDYDYRITPQGVILTGVDRIKGDVLEIPAEIDGVPVVQLGRTDLIYGAKLFPENKQPTEVRIPKSVQRIARDAFANCTTLQRVSFEEGSALYEIGSYAFRGCTALCEIEIPAATRWIGSCAFVDCTALKTLSFGKESALYEIGPYAFWKCSSIESVTLPKNTVKIGEGAFSDCTSLSQFEIDANGALCEIGAVCFRHCPIREINIPKSVYLIGSFALRECNALERADMKAPDGWWYSQYTHWTDTKNATPIPEGELSTPVEAAIRLQVYNGEWRRLPTAPEAESP